MVRQSFFAKSQFIRVKGGQRMLPWWLTDRKIKNGLTQISMENPAASLRGSEAKRDILGRTRSDCRDRDAEDQTLCRRIAGRTQYASRSGDRRAGYEHDSPPSLSGHDDCRRQTRLCRARSIANGRYRSSRKTHRKSRCAHDGRYPQYAPGYVRPIVLHSAYGSTALGEART